MRLFLKLIAPLLTAVLIGMVAWPLLHPRPVAVHQLVLKREMAALRAPPGAKLLDSKLALQDDTATLVNSYLSPWSAERLEEHYLAQLRDNGWKAPQDDGELTALCKDAYRAVWRVSGAAGGEASRYSIAMSWDARRRCAEPNAQN